MAIFERMSDLVRSNINDLIDNGKTNNYRYGGSIKKIYTKFRNSNGKLKPSKKTIRKCSRTIC